jgi:hypothetical protein
MKISTYKFRMRNSIVWDAERKLRQLRKYFVKQEEFITVLNSPDHCKNHFYFITNLSPVIQISQSRQQPFLLLGYSWVGLHVSTP